MKQIPNLFTLLNLIFGCIAIVLILQTGETIVQLDAGGASQIFLPERIWWGALFIFGAAIIDFFDGFLARALKASSEMGKQLDSLSDVVSFGVAPGMIFYQLLRISYAQLDNGLDVSVSALLPAFIFTAAVAWRLAKFNISSTQTDSFIGVPSPAAGLVVASLPLIIFYPRFISVQQYIINHWVLYAIIILLSYFMLSSRRFMALKFKNFGFAANRFTYLLLILSVLLIFAFQWLAVPFIFILYVVFSAFVKRSQTVLTGSAGKETKDITV